MSSADDKNHKNGRPEIADSRQDIQKSKSVITDIMSKAPFVNIKQEKIWNFEDENKEEELDINPDLEWLGVIIRFLSMIIEAALWLIPVVIIFYLYTYREYWLNLVQGNGFKKDQPDIPDTLFGLDIRQETMPDDIENSAIELWQHKEFRQAVSLLYRASLAALFRQYKFELPAGATEQDCIRQIELSKKIQTDEIPVITDPRITRFKDLTQIWINIAYAHRLPDDVNFNQICNGWNQCFSENENIH